MVALFASDASRFRFPPPKPTRFRPGSISYPDLQTPRVEFIVNMMVRIASVWVEKFVFFLNIAAERPGLAPTDAGINIQAMILYGFTHGAGTLTLSDKKIVWGRKSSSGGPVSSVRGLWCPWSLSKSRIHGYSP